MKYFIFYFIITIKFPEIVLDDVSSSDDKTFHYISVCDGTQNVGRYRYFFPVLNIFDTDSGTFYGTKDDTGSETFFRY